MPQRGLFCGTNRPSDINNMSDLEKKHTPVIDCPEEVKAGQPFQVTIRVGEIDHVMEQGHHIQWVSLYSGVSFYARVSFTPVFTKAEVTLTLLKGSKHTGASLRALARCNLHGQWEAQKEINIV